MYVARFTDIFVLKYYTGCVKPSYKNVKIKLFGVFLYVFHV